MLFCWCFPYCCWESADSLLSTCCRCFFFFFLSLAAFLDFLLVIGVLKLHYRVLKWECPFIDSYWYCCASRIEDTWLSGNLKNSKPLILWMSIFFHFFIFFPLLTPNRCMHVFILFSKSPTFFLFQRHCLPFGFLRSLLWGL